MVATLMKSDHGRGGVQDTSTHLVAHHSTITSVGGTTAHNFLNHVHHVGIWCWTAQEVRESFATSATGRNLAVGDGD